MAHPPGGGGQDGAAPAARVRHHHALLDHLHADGRLLRAAGGDAWRPGGYGSKDCRGGCFVQQGLRGASRAQLPPALGAKGGGPGCRARTPKRAVERTQPCAPQPYASPPAPQTAPYGHCNHRPDPLDSSCPPSPHLSSDLLAPLLPRPPGQPHGPRRGHPAALVLRGRLRAAREARAGRGRKRLQGGKGRPPQGRATRGLPVVCTPARTHLQPSSARLPSTAPRAPRLSPSHAHPPAHAPHRLLLTCCAPPSGAVRVHEPVQHAIHHRAHPRVRHAGGEAVGEWFGGGWD
jgi:hypothetical protein